MNGAIKQVATLAQLHDDVDFLWGGRDKKWVPNLNGTLISVNNVNVVRLVAAIDL